ncbi:hypothetical protein [Teichococcus aestuarii]|uniref:hypothetical protein n=1 Tax=Teichococcus aestuarii TaxID=568898 RepID=UPI00360C1A07
MTAPAMAQPRQVPALDTSGLHVGTFDVRAFDPLGMPERGATHLTERQETAPAGRTREALSAATASAVPQGAQPVQASTLAASGSLFSDGWSRNGFGGRSE